MDVIAHGEMDDTDKTDTMEKMNIDPIGRLHKLQEEEFERYKYYKDKYTRELVNADMPDERREKLLEGIDAMAREHSVSDYEKLKFEGVLTPTERYLWTSLFKYLHEYSISFDDFMAIVGLYYMPQPINIALENVYVSLPKHRWIKLQDQTGKTLFGPFEELGTQLDFSLIRHLQIQDCLFSELRRYFDEYHLDIGIGKLCARLRDNLIITNCSFAQFFIKLFIQETGEVPERLKTFGNPDGVTLYHSDVLMSIVGRVIFYGIEIEAEESPIDTSLLLDGVYSTVKIMQGYCAFVSFCSSLLIATLSDEKYQESLLDMMCFFLLNFHNAYIFRIEIPNAPLNDKLSIEERGCEDHTTRMKIYLYDINRVPYVIRVDMPHKGEGNENKLHFNVETLDGDSVLNHKVIDCHHTNPSDLLNVMMENMRRISPGIMNIKDSYKEDDKRMLELMKGFNSYDDLCMAYFYNRENKVAVGEYNKWMGTDCKSVEEGVLHGYISFFTM